jgi:hypothetical protein
MRIQRADRRAIPPVMENAVPGSVLHINPVTVLATSNAILCDPARSPIADPICCSGTTALTHAFDVLSNAATPIPYTMNAADTTANEVAHGRRPYTHPTRKIPAARTGRTEVRSDNHPMGKAESARLVL